MKVIKDNTENKPIRITCPSCGSVIEYDETDVYVDLGYKWVTCPCCNKEIWLPENDDGDVEITTKTVHYPDSFFHFTPEDKVAHVPSDDWVNNTIKQLIAETHKSKDPYEYMYSGTGTKMVFVRKLPDEITGKEIYDIVVANDYHEINYVPYEEK